MPPSAERATNAGPVAIPHAEDAAEESDVLGAENELAGAEAALELARREFDEAPTRHEANSALEIRDPRREESRQIALVRRHAVTLAYLVYVAELNRAIADCERFVAFGASTDVAT